MNGSDEAGPRPNKSWHQVAKRNTVRAVVAVGKHPSLSCSSSRVQLRLGKKNPCLAGCRRRGHHGDFRKTGCSANRVHVPRMPRFSARRRISSVDPFGNILSKAGPLTDANTYRFSSQEYHQPSGLSLYLYQAYDPNLQRWLNRDPLGEDAAINLFEFVDNNPVSVVDTDGRQLIMLEAQVAPRFGLAGELGPLVGAAGRAGRFGVDEMAIPRIPPAALPKAAPFPVLVPKPTPPLPPPVPISPATPPRCEPDPDIGKCARRPADSDNPGSDGLCNYWCRKAGRLIHVAPGSDGKCGPIWPGNPKKLGPNIIPFPAPPGPKPPPPDKPPKIIPFPPRDLRDA